MKIEVFDMGASQDQTLLNLMPEGGTTPVPTALIDRAMPILRDTELRVLLVVVRQTLGWQVGKDPYRRKERDWLTQSQLMRRTGRASGAVARAVDALIRYGLIDVLDQAENRLTTAAERRRCLGRLYYRLHKPDGIEGPGESKSAATKSEHAKAHTTKKTVYKNRQNREQNVDKAVEKSLVIRSSGWIHAREIAAKQRKLRWATEGGASID